MASVLSPALRYRKLVLDTLTAAEKATMAACNCPLDDGAQFNRQISMMSKALWVHSIAVRFANGDEIDVDMLHAFAKQVSNTHKGVQARLDTPEKTNNAPSLDQTDSNEDVGEAKVGVFDGHRGEESLAVSQDDREASCAPSTPSHNRHQRRRLAKQALKPPSTPTQSRVLCETAGGCRGP